LIEFDVLASPLPSLPAVQTVVWAVGYDRASGHSIQEVYVEGLRRLLAAVPESVQRFIYVSSTGVYGESDGSCLDEESPCRPVREGGKACLAAELLLRAHRLSDRTVVLRMAGIYGAGRIPNCEGLRRGIPLDVPSHGYLNLIHVDDAVSVIMAAERARVPNLYLVSDGNAVRRRDYYAYLAERLQAPPPRFTRRPSDSPAADRARSSKRICNLKMVRELNVSLAYPSYREGLAAILAAP
jgi:nucleoside-diphosphate-sugar epimerase